MTAEARYRQLESDRNHYLDRARAAARLTLPYLIPTSNEPTTGDYQRQPLPWNGIGARGVHNLASRLLLALLPPTESFFRFTIDDVEWGKQEAAALAEGSTAAEVAKQRSEFDMALARLEQAVLRSIEASNDRVAVHEALLHLIVSGNVLLYLSKEGLRAYHLNRYCCFRDPMGNPLEAIVCELLSIEALPEDVQELVREDGAAGILAGEGGEGGERGERGEYETSVRIYTHIRWDDDKVSWHQEVKGKVIPNSEGQGPQDESPWLPLRMTSTDGQAYGVSYVESACIADLQTAEALSQAVSEGSLLAAQIKYLCKPGGTTDPVKLAATPNGGVCPGNPEDVAPLQGQKSGDLQVAMAGLARVEARLSQAFMLADVRDSERTTAEEVRLQALQIENSLGSVYSILTSEFQAPYVRRRLALLTEKGKIPKLPPDLVQPVVSVGLAAVGRGNDLEKVARFMQTVQATLGPEGVATYVNPSELLRRLAGAMGMSILGLIRSEEDIAKERQAQQQAQQQQQLMSSPMADPQKLAMAAATAQQMQQPPPEGAAPPEKAPPA